MEIKDIMMVTYNGKLPIAATAIHDGHKVRREVSEIMALSNSSQLKEEDPFTGDWTIIGDTRIIGTKSRFEVDLNRPREKAVYIKPEDAWGLKVWKSEPTQDVVDRSLAEYDLFYSEVHKIFTKLENQFGCFVVYDLHTYGHMREGPDGPPADPEKNPEVNIGTGTMNRKLWTPLVDRFISELSAYNYNSRHLDVRENVKFKGGQFSKWIHENFPNSACSIAIEFKKFFMDEWTGIPDVNQLKEIEKALQSTIPGVLKELQKLGAKF